MCVCVRACACMRAWSSELTKFIQETLWRKYGPGCCEDTEGMEHVKGHAPLMTMEAGALKLAVVVAYLNRVTHFCC